MAILSKIKSIGSKIKSAFTPQQAQTKALNQSIAPKQPIQTLLPNISTPQGIGQTQPSGSITLLSKQGVPTGSVIGSSGVGSTPVPSSPNSPFFSPPTSSGSRPSGSFSGGSSSSSLAPPQTQTNALRSSLTASALTGFNQATQNQTPNQTRLPDSALKDIQAGIAKTTPTIDQSAGGAVITGTGDEQKNLKSNPYQAVDKTADSKTQRTQLETGKNQEDQSVALRRQELQTQLDALIAQRDTMIATGETSAQGVEGAERLPIGQQYNPEGQSNISDISLRVKQMEDEIASLLQESPEYTEAKKAVEAKEAEEAQIKANLQTGQTNVAEQPIAYSFISGQQAALERRAQADLSNVYASQIPLQQRLATEQSKRQSGIDVVKAKYGFLGDARDRATDIYKTNYQRSNTLADAAREQQRKLELEKAKPVTKSKTTPVAKEIYDADTILSGIQKDLIADIQQGGSLANLYRAYPEVSRLYIEELYRRFGTSKSLKRSI